MSYLPTPVLPHSPMISYQSEEGANGISLSLSFTTQVAVSNTWPTANRAYYIPIAIRYPITITSLWSANGAAVSGNFDIGLYAFDGRKIVSTGSTAQAGTGTIQNVSIAATTIGAGQYYIAMAMDNTTGRVFSVNPTFTSLGAISGLLQQNTAFVLPASATFATTVGSNAYIPLAGLAIVPTV